MIRACPTCYTIPAWNNAAMTTRREGTQHYILCGCRHLGELLTWRVAKAGEREPIEAAIVAKWETLFSEYTARWTDEQRAAYRDRIWPPASGEPWENANWVKDTRARLRTLPGFAVEIVRHHNEPREIDDTPFGQ